MTSTSLSKPGVTPPTKLQLALALAVLKGKPPGQSVKEYILQVRQFIKKTKDLDQPAMTDKFFDSVSFWQQAYERSEAGQRKLQDQVHELNQRIEGLLAKMHAKVIGNENESVPANKRKAPAAAKNANSSNMTRKRTKLPKSLQKSIPLMDDDDSGEEDDGTWFPFHKRVIVITNVIAVLCLNRQLHTVQKALQRRTTSSAETNSLAMDAAILCKSAEQRLIQTIQNEISMTEQKPSQTEQANTPDTDTVMKSVTVAFHLTHKALHKIAGAENSMQYQGQAIFYLVGLFESTMTAFTLHCTAISKQKSVTKTKSGRDSKSVTGTDEQKKRTKEKSVPTKNEIASHLADLLCTMALSLNLTRTEDKEVMEGFLFLVLDRMGKVLALHVFHDLRLPMGLCPGMTFPDGLEAMTDEGLMPNEAQLEAKYLVRLLDRMLNAESRESALEASAARQFIANAKDRLQKTLLRAVFGPDDRLFREGLRRPHTPPPQVLDGQHMDQEKFSDWLTQELWRLVGWDVLRTVLAPT
ncbi:hypothetical protein VN97_g1489 [Penicillium thymicola]|uniref:Uncharacterized protein n=1 Tax=Penicillium thymicola TaxID=293382 RepID=A0AAI9TRE1_PENTH|nr:hypothetical protein VN97_g1489 [Penicillium thymicola]